MPSTLACHVNALFTRRVSTFRSNKCRYVTPTLDAVMLLLGAGLLPRQVFWAVGGYLLVVCQGGPQYVEENAEGDE